MTNAFLTGKEYEALPTGEKDGYFLFSFSGNEYAIEKKRLGELYDYAKTMQVGFTEEVYDFNDGDDENPSVRIWMWRDRLTSAVELVVPDTNPANGVFAFLESVKISDIISASSPRHFLRDNPE